MNSLKFSEKRVNLNLGNSQLENFSCFKIYVNEFHAIKKHQNFFPEEGQ
jgi:hypothetical protein